MISLTQRFLMRLFMRQVFGFEGTKEEKEIPFSLSWKPFCTVFFT